MIIKIIVILLIYFCICELQKHFIFGCGRQFKRGRKCARWDCPNKSKCLFSKFYMGE